MSQPGRVELIVVYAYLNIDDKKKSYIRSLIYWAANCTSTMSLSAYDSLLPYHLLESRKQAQLVYHLDAKLVTLGTDGQEYIINIRHEHDRYTDKLTTTFHFPGPDQLTSSSSSLPKLAI